MKPCINDRLYKKHVTRTPTLKRPSTPSLKYQTKILTTKRQPPSTTSKPRPRTERITCYACGSLFSTDAPDCPTFNSADPKQQKLCKLGEACLHYDWRQSSDQTSVIRECFPTSILLGSIEDPISTEDECRPVAVESEGISACVCTNTLCNGILQDKDNQHEEGNTNDVKYDRNTELMTQFTTQSPAWHRTSTTGKIVGKYKNNSNNQTSSKKNIFIKTATKKRNISYKTLTNNKYKTKTRSN